jgi:hypothetical protein
MDMSISMYSNENSNIIEVRKLRRCLQILVDFHIGG